MGGDSWGTRMVQKHTLVMSLVACAWGGSFVAVKLVLEETSPFVLAFLRFAMVSLIMVIVVTWKKKHVKLSWNEFPGMVVLALTGVTLLYALQYVGIQHTTAAHAGILINTNVIFIALLSAVIFKEKFSPRKIVGVALGFLGVILVVASTSLFSLTFTGEGDALIILSGFCWAVYSLLGKHFLKKYDPFTITTYIFVLGTLLFIPLAFPHLGDVSLSPQGWLIIGYLAIPCSLFAYVAWYDALTHREATKVAIFLNLIPVSAMVLSFLILQETITLGMILGALCIMYAIYMTERG